MSDLVKFVGEIEAILGEEDEMSIKKRAVYNRAHRAGLDKSALCQVITIRRRYSSNPQAFVQTDPLIKRYLIELDEAEAYPPTRARARGKAA